MVINNIQSIFFHVPKCAGHCIEQFFMPGERDYKVYNDDIVFGLKNGVMTQHVNYTNLLKLKAKSVVGDYFKFAFFRNTWERLASAYYYLKPLYDSKHGDFDTLIRHVCSRVSCNNYVQGWHFGKQTDYIFHRGKPILNFIGSYEKLDEDFKQLCSLITVDYKPLQKTNQSAKPSNWQSLYNDETIELVKNAYAHEIEFFKYEFLQCN